MAILNRVVNILVLVASIAAAVLSYFLFSKREQLTDGWTKMAKMINQAASVLDDNKLSGTNAALELTPEKLKYTEYDNLDKRLIVLKDTAQTIIKQRDGLAATIEDTAKILAVKGVTAKANQNIVSYEAQKKIFQAGVLDFRSNRDKIADGFVQIAKSAEVNISAANIKDPAKFPVESAKAKDAVENIGKRKRAYEGSINNISSTLGIKRPNLNVPTYVNSLGSLEGDVRKYRDEFKATTNELNTAKAAAKKLEKQVEEQQNTITTQRNEIAKQRNEVSRLTGILSADGAFEIPKKILTPNDPECFEHVSGKVDYINPEFGFITINIGRNYVITQRCGIAENLVPFQLKTGMVLTVTRKSSSQRPIYLGRIRVTNVYKDTAVCNPIGKPEDFAVGDAVFFTQDDIKESLAAAKKPVAEETTSEAKTAEAK